VRSGGHMPRKPLKAEVRKLLDQVSGRSAQLQALATLQGQYRAALARARSAGDSPLAERTIRSFAPRIHKQLARMKSSAFPGGALFSPPSGPPWPPGPPGPPNPPWPPPNQPFDPDWPNGVPGLPGLDFPPFTICEVLETRTCTDAEYHDLGTDGSAKATEIAGKRAAAYATAGIAAEAGYGFVECGYLTIIPLPETELPLSVEIRTGLRALFTWIEANPVSEGYARATGEALIYIGDGSGGLLESDYRLLVDAEADDTIVQQQGIERLWNPGFKFTVQPGGTGMIVVLETTSLRAYAPGEHAYISAGFRWEPLRVTLRAGCQHIRAVGHRTGLAPRFRR